MSHDAHVLGDLLCDCPLCRHGRVRARFQAEPALYEDYAKLAAWWCLEKEFPDGRINEGSVFQLVESPLTKPNAALEHLRNTLRSMLGPIYGRQRGDHGD
jgi:hypothetical protein